MKKQVCFFMVFLFLMILSAISPAGQSGVVTFFGPVDFVRGTGEPFIEVKEFSAVGFQAPYVFHLRNGDEHGWNRVSSAHVWLNGELLFGPPDFSQQKWGYDIDVNLKEQNKLEVKIASGPGSKLKIWIEGVPTDLFHFEEVKIYPAGGTYHLANGIILDVPQGAVNEMFSFKIRRLRPEEVQPRLDSYGIEKYFLAGFEVASNYIVFNTPITARIPSAPLVSAADLPFHYEVNLSQQTLSLAGPDSYLNSLMSIAATEDCQGALYQETDPKTGVTVTFCVPILDPSKQDIIAAIKDAIENNHGISCAVRPCLCDNIKVTEEGRDYVVDKECEYYNVWGKAEYQGDCAGIVNSWTFIEDKRPAIITDPPVAEGEVYIINVGDYQTFRYWLEDKLGNDVPSNILDAKTDDPNGVLEILDKDPKTITLNGKSCGNAQLVINAGCENTKTINISVGDVKEIKIDPPEKTILELCEKLQLSAKVYDHKGQIKEGFPVEWSYISPETVWVDLNPETGYLEANGAGEITVYAETCFKIGEIDLTINPFVDLQPHNPEIKVGETVDLLVRVEEKCGEAVENPELMWTIPEGRIISADVEPPGYSVTGVSPGEATLTVTYKGISKSMAITVIRNIESIKIEPAEATIGVGSHLQLNVYDQTNNIVPKDLVSWTIPPGEVISFDPETFTVTGVAIGEATLSATCKGKSAIAKIRVAVVASIEIEPQRSDVFINETLQLKATVKDAAGNVIEGVPVIWTTSNSSIATIDQNTGLVKGITKGYVTITATCADKNSTAFVSVNSFSFWRITWKNTSSCSYYSDGASEYCTWHGEGSETGLFEGSADIKIIEHGTGPIPIEEQQIISFWANGNYQAHAISSGSCYGCEISNTEYQINAGLLPQQEIMNHLRIGFYEGKPHDPFCRTDSYEIPSTHTWYEHYWGHYCVGDPFDRSGYYDRVEPLWLSYHPGPWYLEPDDETFTSFSKVVTIEYSQCHFPCDGGNGVMSYNIKIIKLQ